MFAYTHSHHLAWELLKWTALIALAGAIALSLAHPAYGQDPPALLPDEVEQQAKPMGQLQEATAVEAWLAMQHHEYDDPDLALGIWETVRLPGEMDAWRQVAMAAAHLRLGHLDATETHLERALELTPENATAHYFHGVLALTRADQLKKWALGYRDSPVPYLEKSVGTVTLVWVNWYEKNAIRSFEEAAAAANLTPYQVPMTSIDMGDDPAGPMMPVVPPAVGDMLTALEVEPLKGKSHHVLGDLYLQHGHLSMGEGHLDLAVSEGVPVVFAYEELGRAYEEEGQYGDAARAYLKATTQGQGVIGPGSQAFRNLFKAATGHR